jgi:hypothetical protein
VVVQWSRARQRYERQGILAEVEAIAQAERECLADSELRDRRRERLSGVLRMKARDLVREDVDRVLRGCPGRAAEPVRRRQLRDRPGCGIRAKKLQSSGNDGLVSD